MQALYQLCIDHGHLTNMPTEMDMVPFEKISVDFYEIKGIGMFDHIKWTKLDQGYEVNETFKEYNKYIPLLEYVIPNVQTSYLRLMGPDRTMWFQVDLKGKTGGASHIDADNILEMLADYIKRKTSTTPIFDFLLANNYLESSVKPDPLLKDVAQDLEFYTFLKKAPHDTVEWKDVENYWASQEELDCNENVEATYDPFLKFFKSEGIDADVIVIYADALFNSHWRHYMDYSTVPSVKIKRGEGDKTVCINMKNVVDVLVKYYIDFIL